MFPTTLIGLLTYGTPVMIFALLLMQVWVLTKLRDVLKENTEIKLSIEKLKNEIVWRDVFQEYRDNIETRLKRLESRLNGIK